MARKNLKSQKLWGRVLPLYLTSYVTWAKLLDLSEPQVTQLWNEGVRLFSIVNLVRKYIHVS